MMGGMGRMDVAISINGGEERLGVLTIEVEQIDVTTEGKTVPDAAWEYTDAQGHFHAWSDKGTLPTLDRRVEHRECTGHAGEFLLDEDCDGYDVTVYFCRICGDEVEPKTQYVPTVFREFAPGRRSWTVDLPGVVLDPEVFVSVVVRVPSVPPTVLFGVGRVVDSGVAMSSFDARGTARILGVGELGERKSVEVPA